MSMQAVNNFNLHQFLVLGSIIFTIGLCSIIVNRKSIITMLISIELMLLAVNINFTATAIFSNELTGQIFTIMILTVAAAETAIGLAILVVYHKNRHSIDIDNINQMNG